MRLRRLKLLSLSETKCSGNTYVSEEFCIFVFCIIVHRDLVPSVLVESDFIRNNLSSIEDDRLPFATFWYLLPS